MLILGPECTAALYVAIKVAAEALSRAGGGRIRTLKVSVRVVRRSGKCRGESRSDWVRRCAGPPVSGSFFRDRSVVVRGGGRRGRRCRRRGVDVSFLDGVFCARRCLDFFKLGGIVAASRVIRVPTSDCGSAGRDGVASFSWAFGEPADHTRGFPRAGAGYDRSSLRPFTLALWAGMSLPLSFTICCEGILQLTTHKRQRPKSLIK
jgi:hypothetical protein